MLLTGLHCSGFKENLAIHPHSSPGTCVVEWEAKCLLGRDVSVNGKVGQVYLARSTPNSMKQQQGRIKATQVGNALSRSLGSCTEKTLQFRDSVAKQLLLIEISVKIKILVHFFLRKLHIFRGFVCVCVHECAHAPAPPVWGGFPHVLSKLTFWVEPGRRAVLEAETSSGHWLLFTYAGLSPTPTPNVNLRASEHEKVQKFPSIFCVVVS